jgi:hypothetical protein
MSPVATFPTPPKIEHGRAMYDSIMGNIEPDLLSTALPMLKEKYKNETPEQKEARRKRYNAAFKKYHETFVTYLADLDARIHRYQREAMRSIEERSRGLEEKQLEEMEASLFKLA